MSAANEKAELKRMSINFVIGAIIIAEAVTIAGWIVNLFEDGGGGAGGAGPSGAGDSGTGPSSIWSTTPTK